MSKSNHTRNSYLIYYYGHVDIGYGMEYDKCANYYDVERNSS
jgi:hypothetical protein